MLPNTGDTLQVGDHQNRSTADTHSLLSYTQPSLSPGKEQHPCTNAVCRLQFKIQHHSALQTGRQVQRLGPVTITVQLDLPDCVATRNSKTVQFVGSTMITSLILKKDKKIRTLVLRRQKNNLSLHIVKTKEVSVDYTKQAGSHTSLRINRICNIEGQQLQIPWCSYLRGPRLVRAHQSCSKESTTMPVQLQAHERGSVSPNFF